jgi:hypothetical protein
MPYSIYLILSEVEGRTTELQLPLVALRAIRRRSMPGARRTDAAFTT